jgi:PDZ domain-containing secreted protein
VGPYKARLSLGKDAKEWSYFIRKGSGTVRAKGTDEQELLSLAATVPFDDRQYVKAKHEELGITAEWRQSFDVAILATFMGVPKEGPSAGIALVVGIISALKGLPVRNDLAMTGEITILGKVLPVGGIQQKLRAAYEAGVKEVIIPADNLAEAQALPGAITQKLKITTVQAVDEAIKAALIVPNRIPGRMESNFYPCRYAR